VLLVSPSTAHALTPHAAGRSWVIFVQTNPPTGNNGPILIEGVRGHDISTRLHALSRDNAYETMLIGLIESQTPEQHAAAIIEQYAIVGHMHDSWYMPTADLLAFIHHVAQKSIQELLSQMHPGGLSTEHVDIEQMATILDVSVPTVRRMVKNNIIPYLRWGTTGSSPLRFVPADVVATLQRRSR
jgi:helix-turn-helix protein